MLAVMHQSHDGMQTCMRLDSRECWDMFDAGQGLRQECVLAPHLLNLLFTAVLLAAETSFPADAAIMGSMVQLQRRKETREEKGTSRTSKVDGWGGKEKEEEVQRLWGVLYAFDAGIVSRSSEGLEMMMTVIVTAYSAFGLTVSEAKTEIMCACRLKVVVRCRSPSMQPARYTKPTIEAVPLGGAISADRVLSIAMTRRLQMAWACVQRYKMEICDRVGLRLRLKVRLPKAEVIETLLYGCMMWSPNKPDYDRLRRVHHSMLLRCLGCPKRKRDDHTLSYADALAKTAFESIEATVLQREHKRRTGWYT